jgi:hypothetical protein
MKSLHNEEKEWRLKSRALWLQVGDKNTSFFHKQAKARQHRNNVEEIKTQSRTPINSFEEIKKSTTSHFRKLYTKEGEDNQEQSKQFTEHIPHLINEEDNKELSKEVTVEEVKEVLNQFDPDKAPGPDGFTLHFYKICWSIIKKDLIRMIRYVQKTSRMGGATNTLLLSIDPQGQKCQHL